VKIRDIRADGRKTLEEWVQLVQDKVEWWADVNRVTDLPFHTHKHIHTHE
jgi:hypothetical protein